MYSWSLMHTFAAYYPEKPTDEEKNIMRGWLEGFKVMYPCTHCRGHFQKDYDRGIFNDI
jgi:FAD-linked sulfhydryl oxidase